jgi:hypothetical protein
VRQHHLNITKIAKQTKMEFDELPRKMIVCAIKTASNGSFHNSSYSSRPSWFQKET